jgi:hypothetical protein
MIMERELKLNRKIMRRVYLIYAARTALSPKGLKILILALFAAELSPFSPYLSLGHIVANMPPFYNWKEMFSFHVSAFMQTQFVVQISLVAVALVLSTYVYRFIQHLVWRLARSGLASQSVAR